MNIVSTVCRRCRLINAAAATQHFTQYLMLSVHQGRGISQQSKRNFLIGQLEFCRPFFMNRHVLSAAQYHKRSAMQNAIDATLDEHLGARNFESALNEWKVFVERTQSTHGIHRLIGFAIEDFTGDGEEEEEEDGHRLRRNIVSLWHISQTILPATDFLAYLIVAMVEHGKGAEAEILAKKFAISGTSFIAPLRIMAQKKDLCPIEQFARLLNDVYFSIPKKSKGAKKAQGNSEQTTPPSPPPVEKLPEMAEGAEESALPAVVPEGKNAHLQNPFNRLIWIWAPPKRQPRMGIGGGVPKLRMHKTDLRRLDKLANILLRLWADTAIESLDANSWKRLHLFAHRNRLTIPEQCRRRGEIIWSGTAAGTQPPEPSAAKKIAAEGGKTEGGK